MVPIATQQPGYGFSEKYDRYAGALFRIAITHLGSRHDAEEVLQEAFMKLLYHAPHFESGEHEKAWLIRVTINLCKNRLLNPWHRRVGSLECDTSAEMQPDDLQLLQDVMKLPARYKAVIHLYYYEDYSVIQIAAILKISQSAVKMRLQRGRKLLRMELEGERS